MNEILIAEIYFAVNCLKFLLFTVSIEIVSILAQVIISLFLGLTTTDLPTFFSAARWFD